MEKKNTFFIQIQEPKTVRKTLLEISQQLVEAMKSYEKYKQIKAEKVKKIEIVKMKTNTLQDAADQLRHLLPIVSQSAEKKTNTPSHALNVELEQLNTEIKQLEDELRKVV